MKKIKFKKVLILVLWIAVVSGILVTLGFVDAREQEVKGKLPDITINDDGKNYFIDADDIRDFLRSRRDTLLNQPMREINVYELEKALNAHPAIANAEVSVDVNGAANIDIRQRNPLLRIINMNGESYYIDDEARLMPLSENYTARVPVASGFISEKYVQYYRSNIHALADDTLASRNTVLDEVYKVAAYMAKDTLIGNLIQQIYINQEREMELYPVVGTHKIIFGDGSAIEEKFEKLKIFYKEGLNSMNNWNKYTAINLKYKDQVVCTKK